MCRGDQPLGMESRSHFERSQLRHPSAVSIYSNSLDVRLIIIAADRAISCYELWFPAVTILCALSLSKAIRCWRARALITSWIVSQDWLKGCGARQVGRVALQIDLGDTAQFHLCHRPVLDFGRCHLEEDWHKSEKHFSSLSFMVEWLRKD